MNQVTLLLPERAQFGAQRLNEPSAVWLARGNVSEQSGDPRTRIFDILPRGWPVAAATRQRDAGDALLSAWLRADPAYVRPDINGARLLAYGPALSVSTEDCAALLPPLRPLFGDFGFPIDAPTPTRWYLRLPIEAILPTFATPEQALGDDLINHLPGGDQSSPEARRWRALLNEAQVVLHNHPCNEQRVEAGLPPVNSLWFWGAGKLPDHVRSTHTHVYSDDEGLTAFGSLAQVATAAVPRMWPASDFEGDRVFDLRRARDLALLQRDWWEPIAQALRDGRLQRVAFDFADGRRYELAAGQRWRFWRRAMRSLGA